MYISYLFTRRCREKDIFDFSSNKPLTFSQTYVMLFGAKNKKDKKMDKEQSQNFARLLAKINSVLVLPDDQTIAVYTTLRILNKMKKELGLEVTLEYIESYLSEIEKINCSLKEVADEIMAILDVQKIFKELMG
jgi:hypothetical protein